MILSKELETKRRELHDRKWIESYHPQFWSCMGSCLDKGFMAGVAAVTGLLSDFDERVAVDLAKEHLRSHCAAMGEMGHESRASLLRKGAELYHQHLVKKFKEEEV